MRKYVKSINSYSSPSVISFDISTVYVDPNLNVVLERICDFVNWIDLLNLRATCKTYFKIIMNGNCHLNITITVSILQELLSTIMILKTFRIAYTKRILFVDDEDIVKEMKNSNPVKESHIWNRFLDYSDAQEFDINSNYKRDQPIRIYQFSLNIATLIESDKTESFFEFCNYSEDEILQLDYWKKYYIWKLALVGFPIWIYKSKNILYLVVKFYRDEHPIPIRYFSRLNSKCPFSKHSKNDPCECKNCISLREIINIPKCDCGYKAIKKTVGNGTINVGKKFYACSHRFCKRCFFFCWA